MHGLKFPGRCPKNPPTQSIGGFWAVSGEVLVGVSFSSDRPSYLFRDVNERSLTRQLALTFNNDTGSGIPKIQSHYLTSCSPRGNYLLAQSIVQPEDSTDDYLILESIIHEQYRLATKPLECNPPIKEQQVRVWFHDPTFIIWSCVNTTALEYDEAVLLAIYNREYDLYINTSTSRYFELMQEINTCGGYEILKWTHDRQYQLDTRKL